MTSSRRDGDSRELKCPECRRPLRKRRSRTPDECNLVCGGCGAAFDICDPETAARLKKE